MIMAAYEAQEMAKASPVAEVVDFDKINGIERPYNPKDEAIPTSWTTEHLSKRLVAAFKTLEKTPRVSGPKPPGGNWPKHAYTWEDQLAWQSLLPSEIKARDAQQNYVADRPTSADLRQMEACFEWLVQLRRRDTGLGLVVTMWALRRSRDQSIKDLCREKGWSFKNFYRKRDHGLTSIVDSLNAFAVAVF